MYGANVAAASFGTRHLWQAGICLAENRLTRSPRNQYQSSALQPHIIILGAAAVGKTAADKPLSAALHQQRH